MKSIPLRSDRGARCLPSAACCQCFYGLGISILRRKVNPNHDNLQSCQASRHVSCFVPSLWTISGICTQEGSDSLVFGSLGCQEERIAAQVPCGQCPDPTYQHRQAAGTSGKLFGEPWGLLAFHPASGPSWEFQACRHVLWI